MEDNAMTVAGIGALFLALSLLRFRSAGTMTSSWALRRFDRYQSR
jgi:hypothetical protein